MNYSKRLISYCFAIFFAFNLSAQCFPDQSYFNPGEYTFTVPGMSSETFLIEIEARGGDGGDFLWGTNPQTDGGQGATMGASFNVNGGDELLIIVGQSGFDAIGSPGGGGGGGGTAVIINNTEVLIAAAAGGGGGQQQVGFGAGASTNSTAGGGAGPGTSGGGGFNQDGMTGGGGSPGTAGTLFGQGQGGTQGLVAGPGGNGFGGGAGGSGTVGGGGGGYQGGDGATGTSGAHGGLGGDSFITSLYGSMVLITNAGFNGSGSNVDGSVMITCQSAVDIGISVVAQVDPTCFGSMDGSIEVVAVGGTSPYTFSMDGGSSQSIGLFENLAAGTYNLEVQDADGVSASVDVTLSNPAQLEFNLVEIFDVSCFASNDGSIEIVGNGGTSASGTYSYSISGGSFQNSGLFSGLSAGDYLLVVQDDNGCTIDGNLTIEEQSEVIVIIVSQTDSSCPESPSGTASVTAIGGSGGFSYSLDGIDFQTSATFSNLAQGDYTITAIDNNGCTGTTDLSIGVMDPYSFLILSTSDSNCGDPDGDVNMLAVGGAEGFTYSIDGSNFQQSGTFNGLAAGTYIATASDASGCMQELEFIIGMSNDLTVTSSIQEPVCAGDMNGTIDLTLDPARAPYTFMWIGEGVVADSEDQNNIGGGTYSVIVNDVNGCSLTLDFVLDQGITLSIDGSDVQNVTCNGGTNGFVALSVSGGTAPYTYMLNGLTNTNGTFEGLAAGDYPVEVTDSNGCFSQVIVTITEPLAIILTVTDQTEAGCNGDTSGTVSVDAENGAGSITYALNGITNTSGNFTGLAGGSYTANATDENGCTAEIVLIILQNSTLSGSIISMGNPICNGSNDAFVTIEASDGSGIYTYTLDNGDSQDNGEFTGLSAGAYSIEINDSEGCSFIVPVTISETASVVFVIDNITDASCFGLDDGSVTFHIAGGTAPYNLISDGNEIEVLNNEPQLFEEVMPGTYQVFVSDANGCVTESSVTINQPEEIVLVIDYLNHVTCFGAEDASIGFHIEGGTAPYLLTNTDGSVEEISDNNIVEFTDGGPEVFDLVISDANGCSINSTVTVTEPDVLEFVINEQLPASCFGMSDAYISFMIVGGTAPYTLIDEDGNSNEVENSETIESDEAEAGIYPLTIIDANGCTIETIVTITEPELLVIDDIIIVDSDDTGNGSITIEASGGTAPYIYALDNEDDVKTNPVFSGLSVGSYEVIVIDANGCRVSTTVSIITTDVSDISGDILDISVGPNPASQAIHINLDIKENIEMYIHVIDIQGKSVLELNPEFSLGQQTISLDIENFHSGLYLINVTTKKGHFTKRILVQQ